MLTPLLRAAAVLVATLTLATMAPAQILPPGMLPSQDRTAEPPAGPGETSGGTEAPGGAETPPAAPPADTTAETAEAQSDAGSAEVPAATSAADAEALIRLLQDDAARERLIQELEAIAADAGPGPDPGAATAPEEQPAPKEPNLGDRLTGLVPMLLDETYRDTREVYYELRATVRRLGGFAALDGGELRRILAGLAPVAAAALVGYVIARRIAFGFVTRLAESIDPERILRNGLIALASLALDLGSVLVGASVGFLTLAFIGTEDATLTSFRVLFLLAFAVSGAFLVAIRAVLSPALARLRLVPMREEDARYWARRLGLIVIVLAFGELLGRNLVAETVSPIAARATIVTIHFVVGVYMVWLVIANRHAPSAFFERRAAENDADLTYSILAYLLRYWHYIAIAFLLMLMHEVIIARSGALPLVLAATEVVAAFVVGAFLITLITRVGEQGVRVPARIQQTLPGLEDRINSIFPAFLRLLRFLVLVLWIAYTFGVVGILDIGAWLERNVGVDVLGAAITILVIALAGFGAWLLLSSWIDYRLTPRRGYTPTPRERTLLTLLRNAATVVILITGLMLMLSELGISIAPLLASAGVVGLAIGFGAQKMVEDIIGGAFIQFENVVNVGDVVEAAGVTGVVEQLTVRSIGLRDLHGVYHVIPFSAVSTVSNFTKGFGHHVADIHIAYRENIDRAKTEMLAAYDDLKGDPEVGPKLIGDLEWFGVETLGDSSIVLRARLKCWPGEQWALGRAYNEFVKNRFDSAGIEIPFPQMTITVEDGGDKGPRSDIPPLGRKSRTTRPRAAPIRAGSPTDADSGDADAGSDR